MEENTTPEKKERKVRVKKSDIPLTESTEVSSTNNDFIENEIKKFNIADATIMEWGQIYGKLIINGPDDEEGYKAVVNARSLIKKRRIDVEKVGKGMRANAIQFQKAVISEEKRIIELIDPIETHLDNEKERIDIIKDAAKTAKDTFEQSRLQERAVHLIQAGCTFDGDVYILDDIRISVLSVKQSDDFTWTTLFAAVETKHKLVLQLKAEENEKRLLAEATNKRILEENLAKQNELKQKEDEIAAREKAIADAEAKAKLDAENAIVVQQLATKQKEADELAKKEKEAQDQLKMRKSALFQLGFSQQADALVFATIRVPENVLLETDMAKWSNYIYVLTQEVHKAKAAIEADRVAREERIRIEAIALEKKRAEEEAEADRIAALEKEAAIQKEKNRLALLTPDIDKFNAFCKAISIVPVPAFTSPSYIAFTDTIKADVLNILKTLHSKKPV